MASSDLTAEANNVEILAGLKPGYADIRTVLAEETAKLRAEMGEAAYAGSRFPQTIALFEDMVTADDFCEFLTLPAYEQVLSLEAGEQGRARQ